MSDARERVEVRSTGDLWAWLGAKHTRDEGVWLVTWKAARPDRYVPRDAVLDALIAYGWIDGRRMKLDEERTMQLISPRRQEAWAKSYRERVERLRAEGRMRPPGEAVVERATRAGTWEANTDVDALTVPDDLDTALRQRAARTWWDASAPSYRRNVLRWIAGAKRAPTRAKRVETVADHAARGKKVPQY